MLKSGIYKIINTINNKIYKTLIIVDWYVKNHDPRINRLEELRKIKENNK